MKPSKYSRRLIVVLALVLPEQLVDGLREPQDLSTLSEKKGAVYFRGNDVVYYSFSGAELKTFFTPSPTALAASRVP